MLLDQVSATQMQAGRLMVGAAMVAFLGARMLGRQAQWVRTMVAVVYVAGVAGWLIYFLM